MNMEWQLKQRLQIGRHCWIIAVHCDEYHIIQVEYLKHPAKELKPQNMLAEETARQIKAYCRKPRGFVFELPLVSAKTGHQRKTRAAIQNIPGGQTRTYGEIAHEIRSSARAVGGACRANEIPFLVPCHRVVAADGLGGFMGSEGDESHIKTALLEYESA